MRWRQTEGNSSEQIPIIGCTAHALHSNKQKSLHAGMDNYLPKPLSLERLQVKITSCFQLKNSLYVSSK